MFDFSADTTVSIIATAVSLCSVIIVFRQAYIAKKAYNAQVDPEIITYLAPSQYSWDMANFVIKNIGNGPASDITFSITPNLPVDVNRDFQKECNHKPTILFLEPNGERRYALGSFPKLIDQMGETKYIVDIEYSDCDLSPNKAKWKMFKKRRIFRHQYKINGPSFYAWTYDPNPSEKKQTKALESMAKSLSSIANK